MTGSLSDGNVRPRRFSVPAAQVPSAVMGLIFAFIGLCLALSSNGKDVGGTIFGVILVVVGLLFSYRGIRSTTVVLTPREVVLRSFIRTRRFALTELTGARVAVGQTGMNGRGREYLVLQRVDGSEITFRELNTKRSEPGGPPTVVDEAVRSICDAVAR